MKDKEASRGQTYRWLTLGLLVVIATLILSTFAQYGMSWDEHYRFKSGDAKLNYYQQLFSGQKPTAGVDHYPGLFDLTLAVIHSYFPWNRITTGHLLSSLFGIVAIIGVAMTSRMLGGWSAAFWAVLFLVTLPRFYGHIFFNPKDIPFAATYIWGLYYLLKYLGELVQHSTLAIEHRLARQSLGTGGTSNVKGPRWQTAMGLGIAFGMCMSMRVGGLILFCYLGMALGLAGGIATIRKQLTVSKLKATLIHIMPQLLVSGVIASLILLFWWPHAHGNFFKATSNTLEAITTWQASGSGWQLHVLFDGDYYKDTDLPFYYWPWMFIITTPLCHLLLILGGVPWAIFYFVDKLRSWQSIDIRCLSQFMVMFTAIFPIVFLMFTGANVFDGIRHLLFVLTPLAVCAGIFMARILALLSVKCAQKSAVSSSPFWSSRFSAVSLPLLFILLTLSAWSMVKLHPYQYTFYNALVGGTQGAASDYETDYWGTSNRAAVEALVSYLKANDPQFSQNTYVISASNASWLSSRYFPDNLQYTAQRELADFYIGNTRFEGHELMEGDIIVEIKADDTLVCVVKDKRVQKKAFVEKLMEAKMKEDLMEQ